MSREIGDNSHGIRNEANLVNALDGKKYKELNLNLKKFIDYICANEKLKINVETIIHSDYETNNKKKQDLYIKLLDKKYGISVKMGSGNSTHQEKCEDFITYITDEFDAPEEICNDIRIFTWCDGTLDGSGKVTDRMDKKKYLLTYKEGVERIRKFVDEHKRELVERALFIGKYNSQVDYIYHGTPNDGKWISANELIEFQIQNPQPLGSSLVKIGRMNLQVWNRSLNGTSDHKRGEIQLKYSSMEDDLAKIMHSSVENVGTFEGDQEEFNISKLLNKNKKSKLWDVLGFKETNDDIYAVKVMYNAYSQIAKKKVKTKTDAYLIKANIGETLLLECEYGLTEDMLAGKEYDVVSESGISVKKSDSTKYTYEKLSRNAFENLFAPYIYDVNIIFCGLTIYQEEKNIALNSKIISDLDLDENDFLEYFKSKISTEELSLYSKNDVKLIRGYCESELRKVIENNVEVKEKIFTGKGCFEAPYYVDYIYRNGELSKDVIPDDYQISNGSGRSKGKYTVIFKPRK